MSDIEASEIDDLRDRLALFRDLVCPECECAVLAEDAQGNLVPRCPDCWDVLWIPHLCYGACISVGMRALCGRKLIPKPTPSLRAQTLLAKAKVAAAREGKKHADRKAK